MGSLHTITRKSVADYITSKRDNWLLKWPGQVVLSVSQIFWTKAVDDTLRSSGTEGLQKFAQDCSDTLKSEVELVRGELTKLQRATMGAQVVIDVHARDVLAEMAKEGVCSETDFAWQAQLRYVARTLLSNAVNTFDPTFYVQLGHVLSAKFLTSVLFQVLLGNACRSCRRNRHCTHAECSCELWV